jgi:hypothetical protein
VAPNRKSKILNVAVFATGLFADSMAFWPVPEPSTAAFLGIVGIALFGYRRKNQASDI